MRKPQKRHGGGYESVKGGMLGTERLKWVQEWEGRRGEVRGGEGRQEEGREGEGREATQTKDGFKSIQKATSL